MFLKIKGIYEKYAILINLLSLCIGVFGLILTISISNKPVILPKKELTCTLMDTKSLVLNLSSDPNFKIIYGEEVILNPFITSIKIENTGSSCIDNSDFKKSFDVQLTGITKVLSANITKANNQHITDELLSKSKLIEKGVTISDFLLNPGESFYINIISDGKVSKVTYDYRLKDISDLILVQNQMSDYILVRRKPIPEFMKSFPAIIITVMIIILFISVMFSMIAFLKSKKKKKITNEKLISYGIDINCINKNKRNYAFNYLELYCTACQNMNYDEETTKEILLGQYDSILQKETTNDK